MSKLVERRNHRFVRESLSAYLDGELSEREAERVCAHLERCPECRQEMKDLQIAIRALSAFPRVALPCSFVLSPEAIGGQQRIRRLDAGFAALRMAGVALSLTLALLVSGEQLLARGIVELPAGSAAPAQVYDVAAEPALAQKAMATDMQREIVQTEAIEMIAALAAPELETDGAPEVADVQSEALALEVAEAAPAPEDPASSEAAPAPQVTPPPPSEPSVAAAQEQPTTQPATQVAQAESTKAAPGATRPTEETRPLPGIAEATPPASAGEVAVQEPSDDGRTPEAAPPEAAPDRFASPAHGAITAGQTPTLTLALTPTETPLAEASSPQNQGVAPKPTHTPTPEPLATEAPPTAVEAQGVADAQGVAAPADEPSSVLVESIPAPEEEISHAAELAPYPEELALALALRVQEQAEVAAPDEPAQELAAVTRVGPADPTPTVRAMLRQAMIILGGITLVVFGGLLWVGHRRRL